uniref:Uncharacterized protein n=1 Tax=Arundo donax TaxID=35708 RepID=A0A0A9BDR2_ARUDO
MPFLIMRKCQMDDDLENLKSPIDALVCNKR